MNGEQLAEEQAQRIRVLEAAEVAAGLAQKSREPAFRVFCELGRWVRMQTFMRVTGLSKEATALCFVSRDIDSIGRAINNIAIGVLKLQGTR